MHILNQHGQIAHCTYTTMVMAVTRAHVGSNEGGVVTLLDDLTLVSMLHLQYAEARTSLSPSSREACRSSQENNKGGIRCLARKAIQQTKATFLFG